MFEQFKNMGNLLKEAQKMKSKMKDVQKELKETKVTQESDNKAVSITLNGEMDVLQVIINEEYAKANSAADISASVKNAMSKAIKSAKDLAASKLSSVTGGMNIPGLT